MQVMHPPRGVRGRGRSRGEAQPQKGDGPVGGQVDLSLLKSFRRHVAQAILEGEERGKLRLHHHSGLLVEWEILDDRLKERVNRSGLLLLCSITNYSICNSARISAVVERWHTKTNTFHFDFGEMGMTLDDV